MRRPPTQIIAVRICSTASRPALRPGSDTTATGGIGLTVTAAGTVTDTAL